MISIRQAFAQAVNECFESDFQDIISKFEQLEKITNN